MKLITLIKIALTFKPYTDKVTSKQREHYCINVETSIMNMTVSEIKSSYQNKRKTQKKRVNAITSSINLDEPLSPSDRCNIDRMTFKLSFYEYVKVISTGKCYYTGRQLRKTEYSIDRIDPRHPYAPGNVVLSSPEFNSFKGTFFDALLHENSAFAVGLIKQISGLNMSSQLPKFTSLGKRAKSFHAFVKSSEVFCSQKSNGGSL